MIIVTGDPNKCPSCRLSHFPVIIFLKPDTTDPNEMPMKPSCSNHCSLCWFELFWKYVFVLRSLINAMCSSANTP